MASSTMLAGSGRHGAAGGFGRVMGGVVGAIAREYKLRRQIAFLLKQDDRMLADIGLTHDDVVRMVRCGRDV